METQEKVATEHMQPKFIQNQCEKCSQEELGPGEEKLSCRRMLKLKKVLKIFVVIFCERACLTMSRKLQYKIYAKGT